MDRRNGGDPLAPPRPPKLLPRVHRPRAPEPTSMMSSGSSLPELMHCTNHSSSSSSNNNHGQQISNRNPSSSNNNNNNNNNSSSGSGRSALNNNNNDNNRNVGLLTPILSSSLSSSFSSNSSSSSHHHHQHHQHQQQQTSLLTTPLLQQHMQHQQQQQQQSHTSTTSVPPSLPPPTPITLNRNNSNLSSSSGISCANSFTRRRPQPPLPPPIVISVNLPLLTTATATTTTTTTTGSSSASQTGNSSHFNSSEPVPISPVTLAAPRPESERLTNEYVDTPFRSAAAQQLHQASRTQHPAGQTIHGQTTTQHNLLLQHSQRQQQQQQHSSHQHHQHYPHQSHHHVVSASRGGTPATTTTTTTAAAATSPATTTTIGGICDADIGEESLHSSTRSHKDAPATTASTQICPATTDTGTVGARLQQQHRTNLSSLPIAEPIIKQPVSFTKDLPATLYHEEMLDLHHIGSGPGGAGTPTSGTGSTAAIINGSMVGGGGGGGIVGDSSLNPITCPRCDRCRCEQCQSPRQLPQTWVCNKTCLCSAETIIDYASCLCCVKALFYHCARDHEIDVCDDGDATLCVDDPCSCLPHKRGTRWGWLGALSLVLPCLWCYWPMRGCVAICAKCYARHAGHGCRCQTVGSTSSMLPIVPLGGGGGGGLGGGGTLTDGNGRGGTIIGGVNSANPRKDCAGLGGGKSSGISGGVHSGISGSGNRHHHSDCSAANRILRKCDLTPEKRLLDSSAEY